MVSENILVRSHKSFRNKEERRSYMVSVVREILGNLQKCMKSKKINETDKRHCMLHLHIHATLYSIELCAGWLYLFGNDNLLGSNLADVSFGEMFVSQIFERNEC